MRLVATAALVATVLSSAQAQDQIEHSGPDTRPSPVLDLGYAKYQGLTNLTSGVTAYRGIRYAQSPVGDLRWRAPLPIELNNNYATAGIINATTNGPFCYQSNPLSLLSFPPADGYYNELRVQNTSEDCLLLNILRPNTPKSNYLPILLQIHGGGYNSGGVDTSPGNALVNRSDSSLIYVDIQYRLGMLGFLGGAEVAADGSQNAGLLDQRAALEWVQRNARSFGGDPARVTIIGGSAGGGSVTYQLTSYGGSGSPPFSAAIAEYPWWQPLLNASSQAAQYQTALATANCSSLACLRGVPTETMKTLIQGVQNASYLAQNPGDGYGTYYFGPVVDGEFVRELPGAAFRVGHYHKVPLVVDRDMYEGFLFTNMTQSVLAESTMDAELLFPAAGPSFFSRLEAYYPRAAYNSTLWQRQTWFGDFIISCPTYYMASSAVDRVANASQVWKMVFNTGTQLHAATSEFLFSPYSNLLASNQTLGEYMTHWFVSFALHRDPNVGAIAGAPYWPSYVQGSNVSASSLGVQPVGFSVLQPNYGSIDVGVDPDATAHCDFFNANGEIVRN